MRLTLTLLMAVNLFIIVGLWCVHEKRHVQEIRFNTSVQLTPKFSLTGEMGLWELERQTDQKAKKSIVSQMIVSRTNQNGRMWK